MRTIRLKTRGVTAFTAVLALSAVGAFAQEDQGDRKKTPEKEPAKAAVQKKTTEKNEKKKAPEVGKKAAEAKVEVRITGVDGKDPGAAKRPSIQIGRRPSPHSHGQKLERRPWLGIAMRDVPQPLREYLELADGFGVQVEVVIEKSPAGEAGLKANDILTMLDDQKLISPEHVALLVRSQKKGAKVTLSFIRKGKEQSAEVTLGERELPPFSNASPHGGGGGHDGDGRGHDGDRLRGFQFDLQPTPGRPGHFEFRGNVPMPEFGGDEFHKELNKYQDLIKEWLKKNPGMFGFRRDRAEPGKQPAPAKPAKPAKPSPPVNDRDKPPARLKPIPPLPGKSAGKPPAISVRPGFPLQVFGGAGLVKIDNSKGAVTISVSDGDHKITITNTDGETVYEGPYDAEKGPKGLPKEAQEQLKEMKLDDLKLLTPPQPRPDPDSKPGAKSGNRKPEKKGELL